MRLSTVCIALGSFFAALTAACGSGSDGSTGNVAASAGGSSGAGGGGQSAGTGGKSGAAGGAARACTPGSTQTCVGDGACKGGQACLADGSAWGVCKCAAGTGGSAGSSSGGAGTAGSSGANAGGHAGASGGQAGSSGATSHGGAAGGDQVGGAGGDSGVGAGGDGAGQAGAGAGGSSVSSTWSASLGVAPNGWPNSPLGLASSIAVGSDGSVYAAGLVLGKLSDGKDTGQYGAVFVEKLDTSGDVKWLQTFEYTMYAGVARVVVDANDNVLLSGWFNGSFNPGTGLTAAAGASDIFFLSLDASGAFRWGKTYGGTGDELANDMAISSAGEVAIVGYGNTGFVDLGAGPANVKGIFAAFYDPSGAGTRATEVFGAASNGVVAGYQSDGTLLIGGGVSGGTATFGTGGTPVAPAMISSGQEDLFVAGIDKSGKNTFTRHILGPQGSGYVHALTVGPDDGFVATATLQVDSDLGDGMMTPKGEILAAYTATNTFRWAKSLPPQQGLYINQVAVTGIGDVLVIGYNSTTINFGGGDLTPSNADSSFLARYTSNGSYGDARLYADSSLMSLALTSAGDPIVGGSYGAGADFGAGALTDGGVIVALVLP